MKTIPKYFSAAELIRSRTADELDIDNTPDPTARANLAALATKLLDPVRELWGGPIKINSGFRSPELNRAVKGAPNSQHTEGEAADITVGAPAENKKLFEMILAAQKSRKIEFDQLIDEKNYSWLHISFRAGGAGTNNRGKVLHL